MGPLRSVPWYSSLEWMDVFHGAFSEDAEKSDAASARIALWEMKSASVPVAVSITRLLLEALKADREGRRTAGELQMLYGTAIVRFVNCYVDQHQNRVYAQSIASIAYSLGIPGEIVDCRHKITHEELPTLQLLRHTAGLCFDYIRENYWVPQAQIIQSGLTSLHQSKYLASGLVALLHDLQSLSPPDDLEIGLRSLMEGSSSSSSFGGGHQHHFRNVLFAAAAVAGLKPRDAMRTLRAIGMAEFSGQQAFVSASAWCDRLRKILPKCLSFLESVLQQCSHDNIALSFLKDLTIVVFDPHINVVAVMVVFWTLGQSSPNLTCRLVTRMINSLIGTPEGFGQPMLPSASCSGNSDFRVFGTSPTDNCHGDNVGNYCMDSESFGLWLRLVDVGLEEEEHLRRELLDQDCYQARLLNWLRTLLLLPLSAMDGSPPPAGTPSSNETLPVTIELLLHLFYDVSASNTKQFLQADFQRGASALTTHRGIFCSRFLQCTSVAHGRVVAACRANLRTVARLAFRALFIDQQQQSPAMASVRTPASGQMQRGLKSLLDVFAEADVVLPYGAASRLISWMSSKSYSKSNPRNVMKEEQYRQALSRFYFPPGRSHGTGPISGGVGSSLVGEFRRILGELIRNGDQTRSSTGGGQDDDAGSQPSNFASDGSTGLGHAESQSPFNDEKPPSVLNDFDMEGGDYLSEEKALSVNHAIDQLQNSMKSESFVEEVSPFETPWTIPGTFPVMCDGQPAILEMLPLMGGPTVPLSASVPSILQSIVPSVNSRREQSPRGMKRGRTPSEEGELSDAAYAVQPAKKYRGGVQPSTTVSEAPVLAPSSAPPLGRFVFANDGTVVRDERMMGGAPVVPAALQRLERRIIRAQREGAFAQGGAMEEDEVASDWRHLLGFLNYQQRPG